MDFGYIFDRFFESLITFRKNFDKSSFNVFSNEFIH